VRCDLFILFSFSKRKDSSSIYSFNNYLFEFLYKGRAVKYLSPLITPSENKGGFLQGRKGNKKNAKLILKLFMGMLISRSKMQ
jgi:hypothetical protein